MIYFASNQDSAKTKLIMNQVEIQYKSGSMASQGAKLDTELLTSVQDSFLSCSVSNNETLTTIREVYRSHGILLCPHSAVGVHAAKEKFPDLLEIPTVCILTAHPSKFSTIINRALGYIPSDLESKLEALRVLPKSFRWLRKSGDNPIAWKREWMETIKLDIVKLNT